MNKLWCNVKRYNKVKTVTIGYITLSLSIDFVEVLNNKIILFFLHQLIKVEDLFPKIQLLYYQVY